MGYFTPTLPGDLLGGACEEHALGRRGMIGWGLQLSLLGVSRRPPSYMY